MIIPSGKKQGFTLIELTIVLVIIGLIIGGVMVGQDLIKAAATRAQITQIEKYNSAVNTFKNKYGGIPGDLLNTSAAQFGLPGVYPGGTSCGGSQAYRDGNGLIDGAAAPYTLDMVAGENQLFWMDLSTVNMIDGTFPNSGATLTGCGGGVGTLTTTPGSSYIGDYLPTAKIGYGNFVYVYETGGFNWYGLSTVTGVSGCCAVMTSGATIPVIQAYNIDQKIDDGLPTSGAVVAVYINGSNQVTTPAPNTSTSGGNATSCYDTTTSAYSTSQGNGSGPNCALSFKMQGAAR